MSTSHGNQTNPQEMYCSLAGFGGILRKPTNRKPLPERDFLINWSAKNKWFETTRTSRATPGLSMKSILALIALQLALVYSLLRFLGNLIPMDGSLWVSCGDRVESQFRLSRFGQGKGRISKKRISLRPEYTVRERNVQPKCPSKLGKSKRRLHMNRKNAEVTFHIPQ